MPRLQDYTVKVVDGLGRTVSTQVIRSTGPNGIEREARAYLGRVRDRWTHLDASDRAGFGFCVWDEEGTIVTYG